MDKKDSEIERNSSSSNSNFLENQTTTAAAEEGLKNLDGFVIEKILRNNPDIKQTTILGSLNGEKAIIIFEKKPFYENLLQEYFTGSQLSLIFKNEDYSSYICTSEKKEELKTTVICPASDLHLDRYSEAPIVCVYETKELYETIVEPFILKTALNNQWIYNILDRKNKESEKFIYQDPDPENGFILIPDLKWDGFSIENFYLLAIVNKRGIKSIRDLNSSHLTLLKNILDSGTKIIEEKYGVKKSQLRIYVHYQPAYYHLHIHFNSVNYFPPGIYTEKAILLPSIIQNIQFKSNYYQEATLSYVLRESYPLFRELKEKGYEF